MSEISREPSARATASPKVSIVSFEAKLETPPGPTAGESPTATESAEPAPAPAPATPAPTKPTTTSAPPAAAPEAAKVERQQQDPAAAEQDQEDDGGYKPDTTDWVGRWLPDWAEPRTILLYESAEGGAGVLRRLLADPAAFPRIAHEALNLCHFDPATGEDRHRAPGSIGASSFPSRVLPGMRMGGHMGNEQVTVRNLEIIDVDTEDNVLVVKGAVPGPNGGYVVVRRAKR